MQKKYRRRNYFTKKGFQSRLILRFLVASSAGGILAVGLFNFLAFRKLDTILYSMTIPPVSPGTLLFREALYANLIALVVVLAMFVVTEKRIYHKITGPLILVRHELQKIGRGNLIARIFLREDDEFKDFAEKVNAMVDTLNRAFAGMQHDVRNLSRSVREIEEMTGGESRENAVKRLMEQVSVLEKKVKEFKR